MGFREIYANELRNLIKNLGIKYLLCQLYLVICQISCYFVPEKVMLYICKCNKVS